jgi:heptosyltransferase-2
LSARERILVRLPNWLGDALLARPLLHAVRRGRPGAEITGVGPAPLLDLLAGDAILDRAMAWPADRHGRASVLEAVRRPAPGWALVLPPSFSSAWFAWRSGARVRVGYRHEGRSALLTHALTRPARGELHLSREYLRLGAVIGAREASVPSLPVSVAGDEKARRLLEAGAGSGRRYVILAPGARYGPAKQWPPERFAELGRALAARDLRVLVCGGAAERPVCDALARAVGGDALPLGGRTDLPTQAALCARAAVVVSNDSGLAHLAGAVGAATIALFGSTSSAWTAPLGAWVRIVQHAPVCSPCFRRTCAIGYRCLNAIAVEEVRRACAELAA